MGSLDDQIVPMDAATRRAFEEPHIRAGVLAWQHIAGMVRLSDALLAKECQAVRADLGAQFPELNLSLGPPDPPAPSRLPPEWEAEVNRRVFPLDAQIIPSVPTEEARIAAGIRQALHDSGTAPAPAPVRLSEDERQAIAWMKEVAGVVRGAGGGGDA